MLATAQGHSKEYLGFGRMVNGTLYSCFGSRVDSLDSLPDSVEGIEVQGGLCVHLKQLEFNGDNSRMLYDVC